MYLLSVVIVLSLSCSGAAVTNTNVRRKGIELLENYIYESKLRRDPYQVIDIYCYRGEPVSYLALFKSVYVEFKLVPEHYKLFEGVDEDAVLRQHELHLASWIPLLPWKQSTIAFATFQPQCIGIMSEDDYRLEFVVRKANYWKVFQLCLGVFLFFSIPSLCRNVAVFYAAGVSIGVVASLLIVVVVVSRLLPRKLGAYSVICLGWSLVLYLLQLLWSNVYDVLAQYKHVLMGYLAVSAVVSFAVCYRLGPPSNPRTLDLLQWSLQFAALALVFLSSEVREITAAIMVLMLITYNFPASWSAKARTMWRRRFPPKVVLLTEEEYLKQADEVTRKSLAQLRTLCGSPDFKTWRTVTRLRDPVRFARFVEGESHLSDSEVLQYELDSTDYLSPSDDLLTEDSDNEESPSFTQLAS